jgi:hypothetical protein
VPSSIKGSFTHLSIPVRIIFQLSGLLMQAQSPARPDRQVITITITTTKITVNNCSSALYKISLLIFLTFSEGKYYHYSDF